MTRRLIGRAGAYVAGAAVLSVVATIAHVYAIAASNRWHPVAVDMAGVAVVTVVGGALRIHAP